MMRLYGFTGDVKCQDPSALVARTLQDALESPAVEFLVIDDEYGRRAQKQPSQELEGGRRV